jgi:hypothetical protein
MLKRTHCLALLTLSLITETAVAQQPQQQQQLPQQIGEQHPEGVVTLTYDCTEGSTTRGRATLIHDYGGLRVNQFETEYDAARAPARLVDTDEGYSFYVPGREQQYGPSSQTRNWKVDKISSLKQAIELLREHVIYDHPGCEPRFISGARVSHW